MVLTRRESLSVRAEAMDAIQKERSAAGTVPLTGPERLNLKP
jgi:hypothetical protein